MNSVSPSQLRQRRQQLRKRRRLLLVRSLWRGLCIGGICAGIGWFAIQPWWIINKPEQIQISGNQYLKESTIRSTIGLRYPQPLMQLSPQEIEHKLMKTGSFERVEVDRSLIPPKIRIKIIDRLPVAALSHGDPNAIVGMLDTKGHLAPIDLYQNPDLLPKLILLTAGDRQVCPNWGDLHRQITLSPVKVSIIDCRQPSDLYLKTEVGRVRLGVYQHPRHLQKQLQQLDKLRDWHQHTSVDRSQFLDLENPAYPKLNSQSGSTP
jgi:cell division protein FtsQ